MAARCAALGDEGAGTWRTRPDPFVDVWAAEVEPLLVADTDGNSKQRPSSRSCVAATRTRSRRASSARCNDACASGAPSGARRRRSSSPETFEALLSGLQGTLWSLGGVPDRVRLDNLSAATHELALTGGRSLTKRFADVVSHFGFEASRIKPGESHENGVVEKAHDLLKGALDQALRLRGSREFASVPDYLRFVQRVVDEKFNRAVATKLAQEHAHLRPLPASRLPEYTKLTARVRRWSTINLSGRIYSVPSRFIGHSVEARIFADVVEVRLGDKIIETMPRMRDVVPAAAPYDDHQPVRGHAVTITGYSLGPGDSSIRLRSDRITKLYAHDDAVGPFARMELKNGPDAPALLTTSLASCKDEIGTQFFKPLVVLVPLYHKIRIPFDWVLGESSSLDETLKAIATSESAGMPDLEWTIRLTTVNDYKGELQKTVPLPDRRDVLEQPMPRFMWLARADHPDRTGFDLLFDATDLGGGGVCIRRVDRAAGYPRR